MEKELFDWVDWEEVDSGSFIFFHITLKKQIDKFPVGTGFSSASLDYGNGKLEFRDEKDDLMGDFQLELKVKE